MRAAHHQTGCPPSPIHRNACTGLCPDGWLTAFLPGHLSPGRRQKMYCSSAPPTREERLVSLFAKQDEFQDIANSLAVRPVTWAAMRKAYESVRGLTSSKADP